MLDILANFFSKGINGVKKAFNIVVKFIVTACKSVYTSLKKGERRYVVSTLAVVSAIGIFFGFALTGARVVYRLNYSGKDIATVSSKEDFEVAKNTIVKLVKGTNVESAVGTPEYKTVVALSPDVNSEDELINAIIDNTDAITTGCEVAVNGITRFYADEKTLNNCIDAIYSKYSIPKTECTHSFVEDVKVTKGYFLKEDVLTKDEINYELKDLSVQTVSVKTEEVSIPYKTTQIRDYDMLIGSRQVMIDGVNGLGSYVTTATYINGVLQGEPVTEYSVLYDPVDEAVNIGVAVPSYSGEASTLPGSGYMFPLPTGTWDVSAYFGDGRNHKGLDLCANTGTPIFAVAGGTVVRAEWYSGYGYCVDIDHGFGFITRYGHISEILTSVGQNVEAGEVIALVGSTGDSTGPHLHIEFIFGGRNLDPGEYLGLQ